MSFQTNPMAKKSVVASFHDQNFNDFLVPSMIQNFVATEFVRLVFFASVVHIKLDSPQAAQLSIVLNGKSVLMLQLEGPV